MADPNRLDIGDWFAAGVALAVTLLGLAFPRIAKRLRERKDIVDAQLTAHAKLLGEHVTKLAVLETDHQNVAQHLQDIKDNMQQSAEKLDQLIIKLMK